MTLPKAVREAAGIRPGDSVEVRVAAGAVVIEKAVDDYKERLYALAERRLIRGTTTDELMRVTRGDPALDPKK